MCCTNDKEELSKLKISMEENRIFWKILKVHWKNVYSPLADGFKWRVGDNVANMDDCGIYQMFYPRGIHVWKEYDRAVRFSEILGDGIDTEFLIIPIEADPEDLIAADLEEAVFKKVNLPQEIWDDYIKPYLDEQE